MEKGEENGRKINRGDAESAKKKMG